MFAYNCLFVHIAILPNCVRLLGWAFNPLKADQRAQLHFSTSKQDNQRLNWTFKILKMRKYVSNSVSNYKVIVSKKIQKLFELFLKFLQHILQLLEFVSVDENLIPNCLSHLWQLVSIVFCFTFSHFIDTRSYAMPPIYWLWRSCESEKSWKGFSHLTERRDLRWCNVIQTSRFLPIHEFPFSNI